MHQLFYEIILTHYFDEMENEKAMCITIIYYYL